MKTYIEKIIKGNSLTETEMVEAMRVLMEGKAKDSEIASFLTALRVNGESTNEIIGGAKVMREKATKLVLPNNLHTVDTCGTGGDGANTYNISTASAFILAAGDAVVVKHGNRSVSSKSGSADVLEELGVNLNLTPQQVKSCVEKLGIGFLYAPKFHSAMKHVGGVRKELGFRTIFNMLGPLTNPASAKSQVMGVFDPSLTETMAEALGKLGVVHAMVVHGMDGLDEISLSSKTKVSELKEGKVSTYYIEPKDFGLDIKEKSEVEGGDSKINAVIIKDIFEGKERGAKREILVLNSGAGLYVSGKANSLEEGVKLANEIIDSKKALTKLNEFIKFTGEVA